MDSIVRNFHHNCHPTFHKYVQLMCRFITWGALPGSGSGLVFQCSDTRMNGWSDGYRLVRGACLPACPPACPHANEPGYMDAYVRKRTNRTDGLGRGRTKRQMHGEMSCQYVNTDRSFKRARARTHAVQTARGGRGQSVDDAAASQSNSHRRRDDDAFVETI